MYTSKGLGRHKDLIEIKREESAAKETFSERMAGRSVTGTESLLGGKMIPHGQNIRGTKGWCSECVVSPTLARRCVSKRKKY